MFGCLGRLGCLAVLLVAGALAWFTRERWMGRGPDVPAAESSAIVWEPLTDQAAARARTAVASLSQRSGTVFVNLRPGEVASYIFTGISKQLPPSARDVRAAVIGDRLYVKASVELAELGGADVLGPLTGMLSPRDTLSLGGSFDVIRPGLSQFLVQEIKLREFSVPRGVLPKLMGRLRRGTIPEGVSEVGLPLATPASIADVRIAKGRVTLYKNTQ